MATNMELNDYSSKQLDDIKEKRKKEGSFIRFKKDIIADLIDKAHKREIQHADK